MRNAVLVTLRTGRDKVTEKAIRIDPIHITRLEPIEAQRAK
jgi:hypothetical protein